MKNAYDLALLALRPLLIARALELGAKRQASECHQQHYEGVAEANDEDEGERVEGHRSGPHEAAAEADEHEHDAERRDVRVGVDEAGDGGGDASEEHAEGEGARHGSGRLGFVVGSLETADGLVVHLGEGNERLAENEARPLRLPLGQVTHGGLPAVASTGDLRLAQAALLNVCDDDLPVHLPILSACR